MFCSNNRSIIGRETTNDISRHYLGSMGSSKMRMSECRRRTYLYNELSILEKQITEQWHQIKNTYRDLVTYNGRNYLDKNAIR